MTEQNQTGQCAQDGPAVEITPAMIEAGVEVLISYDADGGLARDVVRQIFSAMFELQNRDLCQLPPISAEM